MLQSPIGMLLMIISFISEFGHDKKTQFGDNYRTTFNDIIQNFLKERRMRIRTLIVVLVFLQYSSFMVTAGEKARPFMKISLQNASPVTIKKVLQSGLDITSYDVQHQSIYVLGEADVAQSVERLGLHPEVILPDADAFARRLRSSGYLEHFQTYPEMVAEMQQIADEHPDIVQMIDIGDSYEKTVGKGGYDIWVMKISDHPELDENEPEVLYMANMHAREIITPAVIMRFLRTMTEDYGSDPYVTYLVNHRQIYLCPSFNPDGYMYVLSGSSPDNYNDPMWWRKNKRDNDGDSTFNPNTDGVDLNRNFAYKWGLDNFGSSPDVTSPTYRGTSAFSEPEAQAIRDFVEAHHIIISLSFHSYSQLLLYPWGYRTNFPTPDHTTFVALADSVVRYNQYLPELAAALYPVNGDTDDWLYGEQQTKNKIYAFTPEVGGVHESVGGYTGFFPDTAYIEKQITENQGPMQYLAWAAGEEPIITVDVPDNTEDAAGPYQVGCNIRPAIPLTGPAEIDSSKLTLFYRFNADTTFDSVQVVSTGLPGKYVADIPGTGKYDTVRFYIRAGDKQGRVGQAPRTAPFTLYSFVVRPDTIPPTIEHTPITEMSLFDSVFTIQAVFHDDSGIRSAWLFYQQNGASIDSVLMESGFRQDEFLAHIQPDTVLAGDIFRYWFVVCDNSSQNNCLRWPVEGSFEFIVRSVYMINFEMNDGGFTSEAPTDWQYGVPMSGPDSAHSGQYVWGTNLAGNYSSNSNSFLYSPRIDLSEVSKARLLFWHWYIIESSSGELWDGGNVSVSVDDVNYQIIYPESGYDGTVNSYNKFLANEPAFGGPITNGDFWQEESFDLTPFAGNNVRIRFHFASDDNTNLPGWYIDDFSILLTPKEQTALPEQQISAARFVLFPNYPNPFNPETIITYKLPKAAHVRLFIYNVLGRRVQTLVDALQSAGTHQVRWNATDAHQRPVASGVYICSLVAGNVAQLQKMVLMR